jgi:hypothetical protein
MYLTVHLIVNAPNFQPLIGVERHEQRDEAGWKMDTA